MNEGYCLMVSDVMSAVGCTNLTAKHVFSIFRVEVCSSRISQTYVLMYMVSDYRITISTEVPPKPYTL